MKIFKFKQVWTFSFVLIVIAVFFFGCLNSPSSQDLDSNTLQEKNAPVQEQQEQQKQQEQLAVNAEQTAQSSVLNGEKSGDVGGQIWQGEILVTGFTFVPKGKTLTVKPGTTVKFKHCRDYKGSCERLSLEVEGKLIAVGTADAPIVFTSNATNPRNGDWSMIRLSGSTNSKISYAVVEFGQQGVNLWKSNAVIERSIIRFHNWEGLYAESYSTPKILYNRVYKNGYNGMALEQFNDAIISFNLFEESGTNGLHVDASKVSGESNFILNNNANGLSLDDHAAVYMNASTIGGNKGAQVACGEGNNTVVISNSFINGKIQCSNASVFLPSNGASGIDFGWVPKKPVELGYIPGDAEKDEYPYVYPDDETRKIVRKIGKGKGLTWSVALQGENVWTVSVNGDVYLFNGNTGAELKSFKAPSPQPWGATFLKDKLWVTDFAEKRTYALDPNTGMEVFSFNNPDLERGAKGLANDGENLLLMGWTTGIIYNLTTQGKLNFEVKLSEPLGAGGIAFDKKNFWVPCSGNICKYDLNGAYTGKIYAASEGTWDLEWDYSSKLLWATQRTNENWQDEKIFALQVLKVIA